MGQLRACPNNVVCTVVIAHNARRSIMGIIITAADTIKVPNVKFICNRRGPHAAGGGHVPRDDVDES